MNSRAQEILSVKKISLLIASYLTLETVISLTDYDDLKSIIKKLEKIETIQELLNGKDINEIEKTPLLSQQRDECNKLSNELCHNLKKWTTDVRFTNIDIAKVTFDTILYAASLTLSDISPINTIDFATQDVIDPVKKIVTSDRHQFDIDSLSSWLQQKNSNPWTRQEFSQRDINMIKNSLEKSNPGHVVEFNQGNPFQNGDPDLLATLDLVRELQQQPLSPTTVPWVAQIQNSGYSTFAQTELSGISIFGTQSASTVPNQYLNSMPTIQEESSDGFRSLVDRLGLSNSPIYQERIRRLTESYATMLAVSSNMANNSDNISPLNSSASSLQVIDALVGQIQTHHNAINSTPSIVPSSPNPPPSSARLFSTEWRQNVAIFHTLVELNGAASLNQLQQWQPHTPDAVFTETHGEVLIHLIRDQLIPADVAINLISNKSEEDVRAMLPPSSGPRMEEVD